MNGPRATLARTATRTLLTVAWGTGTLLALHAALSGTPDPFTGFVLLPAMVLGAAACGAALETTCVRGVTTVLDALANVPGALRALVATLVAALVGASGGWPGARGAPVPAPERSRAPHAGGV